MLVIVFSTLRVLLAHLVIYNYHERKQVVEGHIAVSSRARISAQPAGSRELIFR